MAAAAATAVSATTAATAPAPATARPALTCCALAPRRQCPNTVRWKIDGGGYCSKHYEEFWETHFVEEHRVVRLMRDEWQGRMAGENAA